MFYDGIRMSSQFFRSYGENQAIEFGITPRTIRVHDAKGLLILTHQITTRKLELDRVIDDRTASDPPG